MGQMLKLTQNVNRTFLEWKPTILHDLHEASNYLYASTGTGPYNEALTRSRSTSGGRWPTPK